MPSPGLAGDATVVPVVPAPIAGINQKWPGNPTIKGKVS